mmetsp:Transcript_2484/g.7814  ORF Transcript_2484/g.7814 Transcript_2484/m.7814 type:complete len:211 (-) Transcript_2484:157-789(-)
MAVGCELPNDPRRVAVEVRPRVRPAPVERRQRVVEIEAREAPHILRRPSKAPDEQRVVDELPAVRDRRAAVFYCCGRLRFFCPGRKEARGRRLRRRLRSRCRHHWFRRRRRRRRLLAGRRERRDGPKVVRGVRGQHALVAVRNRQVRQPRRADERKAGDACKLRTVEQKDAVVAVLVAVAQHAVRATVVRVLRVPRVARLLPGVAPVRTV